MGERGAEGPRPGAGLARRLASGALLTVSARGVFALSGLLINALLARHLPAEQFGAYLLCASVVTALIMVSQLGLQITVVRDVAEAAGRGESGRAVEISLRAAAVAAVAAMALGLLYLIAGERLVADLLCAASLNGHALPVMLWLAMAAPLGVLSEAFRGFQEFGRAAWLGGVSSNLLMLGLVTALGAAGVGIGIDRVLMGWAVVSGAGLAVALAWSLGRPGRRQGTKPRTPVGGVLGESLPLMVTSIAIFATAQADLWVAGAVLGEADAGSYGAAVRLVQLVLVPLLVINAVIGPSVAQLGAARDRAALQRLVSGAAAAGALPGLVALGVIIAFAGPLLELVYGPGFARGAPSLVLVSAGQAVNLLCGPAAVTLMMSGHGRTVMWISVAGAVATAGGGAVLGAAHGLAGIALAAGASVAAHGVLCAAAVRVRLGVWTLPDPRHVTQLLKLVRR